MHLVCLEGFLKIWLRYFRVYSDIDINSSLFNKFCLGDRKKHSATVGPPGVLGIWGEWLFIFRELGSNGNYFRGSREQAHIFGDLGSPAKKQKK